MDENREQVRRLMIAIERIDQAYYQAQRRLGIKDAAFVLFYAIADGGPYSQKQICQEWSLPRTTLNTVVQEDVGKGYLRLAATGHKEKAVVLTPAGRAYVSAEPRAAGSSSAASSSSVRIRSSLFIASSSNVGG